MITENSTIDPAQMRARAVDHMDAGAWPEALDAWQEAVAQARSYHTNDSLLAALNGLGIVLAVVNRPADAATVLREAVDLARHASDPMLPMQILGNLGNALMRTRNYAEAAQVFRRARSIAGEFDQAENKIIYSLGIGRALTGLGDYDMAIAHLVDSLRLTLDSDDAALLRRVLDSLIALKHAWSDNYRFACGIQLHAEDAEFSQHVLGWIAMREHARQRQ